MACHPAVVQADTLQHWPMSAGTGGLDASSHRRKQRKKTGMLK